MSLDIARWIARHPTLEESAALDLVDRFGEQILFEVCSNRSLDTAATRWWFDTHLERNYELNRLNRDSEVHATATRRYLEATLERSRAQWWKHDSARALVSQAQIGSRRLRLMLAVDDDARVRRAALYGERVEIIVAGERPVAPPITLEARPSAADGWVTADRDSLSPLPGWVYGAVRLAQDAFKEQRQHTWPFTEAEATRRLELSAEISRVLNGICPVSGPSSPQWYSFEALDELPLETVRHLTRCARHTQRFRFEQTVYGAVRELRSIQQRKQTWQWFGVWKVGLPETAHPRALAWLERLERRIETAGHWLHLYLLDQTAESIVSEPTAPSEILRFNGPQAIKHSLGYWQVHDLRLEINCLEACAYVTHYLPAQNDAALQNAVERADLRIRREEPLPREVLETLHDLWLEALKFSPERERFAAPAEVALAAYRAAEIAS